MIALGMSLDRHAPLMKRQDLPTGYNISYGT